MVRSGTSLVAHALHELGAHLGPQDKLLPPAPDNVDGFWEHRDFVELNDRILDRLGGAWDDPPQPRGRWWEDPDFDGVRAHAEDLIRTLAAHEPAGWKDPRNSLTLPLWLSIVPGLKVVVCLRHPVEVAHSLARRGSASARFSVARWRAYNEGALSATRSERIITHYEAYFNDPERELTRIADWLEIEVVPEKLRKAARTVIPELRHHRLNGDGPELIGPFAEVGTLYERLLDEAHIPPPRDRPRDDRRAFAHAPTETHASRDGGVLERLAEQLQAREGRINNLEHELDGARAESQRLAEANEKIKEEHAQLAARAAAYGEDLRAALGAARAELETLRETKTFRYTAPFRLVYARLRHRYRGGRHHAGAGS